MQTLILSIDDDSFLCTHLSRDWGV